ncbi:MAG: hypothetical protein ACPLYF_04385 [Fervidobacterium sp.]
MENGENLKKIKENLLKRTSTDRIMWFSMWFLLSIITFGLALFLMLYLLIDRRNKHFQRQKELENLILSTLKSMGVSFETETNNFYRRNALLWALSILLVVPIFLAAYSLSKDLLLHERRQTALFRKIFPEEAIIEQKINLKFCMAITLVTLGAGIIYWFYKIFNAYNNHFKEQWRIEDKIVELIERGN